MNPYLPFVESIQAGIKKAKGITAVGKTAPIESNQKILLFSPHPDDECITGLLPLRLMREGNIQIINVPVTYGSNPARQAGRAEELKNACDYLGWSVFQRSENTSSLRRDPFQSLEKSEVVDLLEKIQPVAIFIPHSGDWNSRHVSTHFMVMDALQAMPASFSCTVIETEFWGAMDDPNLLVEGDAQSVADLLAALSQHVGEVGRNPYHLLLPAWMQDNVRRGGELVGGQGCAAPDFSFATLYRVRKWRNRKLFQSLERGHILSMSNNLKKVI
ncbi:MAG: PIG-L family deacetylase [Verrucomicrobia bacterium]|nr:PIG-L family deacetylase [Verrucomicrobiota bacterium]